jgi:hypothetical protein
MNVLYPPQTVAVRTGELVDSMLGVKQYAAHVNAGERTVRTWLAEGRLHSARKLNSVWMIAADDRPAEPKSGDVVALDAGVQHMPQHMPPVGLAARLDAAPAFLELDDAAELLGISAHAIRTHRDYFGVEPFGRNGSLVVPAGVVRRIAGISA